MMTKLKRNDIKFYVLLIFFLLSILASQKAFAQDIQFSQFYANAMYLNPAFAGSSHTARGILHQRLQWPRLDAKYMTSVVSVDNHFTKSGSGLGLMLLRDWQGGNTITSTELSIQYAQEITLTSNHSIRAGIQGGYFNRHLNYARLTFPDQYDDYGYTDMRTNEEFGVLKAQYFDVGIGGLFYTDNYWIGISSHHMNTPNQSFLDEIDHLPMKTAIVGGYRIKLREPETKSTIAREYRRHIIPTFHYKFQGKSDQLDFGLYGLFDEMILGIWYRGIVIKHYRPGLQNNESMVLLAGLKFQSVSFAYSYDFTVSKLAVARTGGSHELNVTVLYQRSNKKKKFRKLPCPRF